MPQSCLVKFRAGKQKQPTAFGNTKPKPSEYLLPFEPEELLRIVRLLVANYDPNIQEDAAAEFVLGALMAKKRAKKGLAVRTYQWVCGMGRVKRFLTKETRRRERERVRLDQQTGGGKAYDTNMHHAIPDLKALDPRNFSDQEDLRREIAAAMERLPDRLRFVIRERFWKSRTLQDIAGELGVSYERARQLLAGALDLMRARLDYP